MDISTLTVGELVEIGWLINGDVFSFPEANTNFGCYTRYWGKTFIVDNQHELPGSTFANCREDSNCQHLTIRNNNIVQIIYLVEDYLL